MTETCTSLIPRPIQAWLEMHMYTAHVQMSNLFPGRGLRRHPRRRGYVVRSPAVMGPSGNPEGVHGWSSYSGLLDCGKTGGERES